MNCVYGYVLIYGYYKMMNIKAVTFDFYMTLIHPRNNKSRGRAYQGFLADHSLYADPWEHQVLYDVFEYYADFYNPNAFETVKDSFWAEFTLRLFQRTHVAGCDRDMAQKYVASIRDIFGPNHFKLYAEVHEVLQSLKNSNLKLAIISNWQQGLKYFCQELGIFGYFNELFVSAELGCQKPDPGIYKRATERLQVPPGQILHVGDSLTDDIQGAGSAGFNVVLLDRTDEIALKNEDVTKISDLRQLEKVLF